MKYLKRYKVFENRYNIEEYIDSMCDQLSKYNLPPVHIRTMVNNLEVDIRKAINDDVTPYEFVETLRKDMDLDGGGFPSQMSTQPQQSFIKYL